MEPESKIKTGVALMIIGFMVCLAGGLLALTGVGCCLGLPLCIMGGATMFIGRHMGIKGKIEKGIKNGLQPQNQK